MTESLNLFSAFFRIGLFMFGGGYSMLPLLEREIVDSRGWATRDELLDYFAIGQCTPGVIAVNTATIIGYNKDGVKGSAFATLGLLTPSLVIILIIASVLKNFTDIPAVIHAFAGIRVAVAALIASSVIKLFRGSVLKDKSFGKHTLIPLALCVLAFVLVALLGASPVYVITGAALAGPLIYGRRESL